MTPTFDPTADIQIWHGDCRALMKLIPDGAVDAVVCDPPFGVRGESWDDMSEREFSRFTMGWLSEARRLSSELIVFTTQDNVTRRLCELLYKNVRQLIWYKPTGSQYAGARECGTWFAYEPILHCHERETWSVVNPKDAEVGRLIRSAREAKGLSRGAVDIATRGKRTGLCYRWEEGACLPTSEQASRLQEVLGLDGVFANTLREAYAVRNSTLDASRDMASKHAARNIDVFEHRTVTKGRHPCEKPVGLMTDLLESVGKEYRSILDPFAGSGSTGVACLKSGRRCVLIESDPRYIPIIERRVSEARTPLFDSPAP